MNSKTPKLPCWKQNFPYKAKKKSEDAFLLQLSQSL